MKNLLFSVMLICAAFTTRAQAAKPTKEETIKFMANVLKSVEGNVVETDKSVGDNTITKYFFDGNTFTEAGYYPNTKDDPRQDEIYTDIKWESFNNDLYIER